MNDIIGSMADTILVHYGKVDLAVLQVSDWDQGINELVWRLKQRHHTLYGLNMAQLPASCHLVTSPALPHCTHCARIPQDVPKGCCLHIQRASLIREHDV